MYHLLLQWELVRVIDEYLAYAWAIGALPSGWAVRAWRCVGNTADG